MHEKKTIEPLEGEPLFTFRAKDVLSTQVLDFYLELCSRSGSVPAHLDGIRERIRSFEAWQQVNPEHVRMPD